MEDKDIEKGRKAFITACWWIGTYLLIYYIDNFRHKTPEVQNQDVNLFYGAYGIAVVIGLVVYFYRKHKESED